MSKEAFVEAAQFFMETIERIRPEQWDSPGLGVWSVRDLTGHASRALLTVAEYAAKPADSAQIDSAVSYYHQALAAPDIDQRIAERGHEAGARLGNDPLSMIKTLEAEALEAVRATPQHGIITTQVGPMRFDHYLQTRVLELVVHTLDIANAVGGDLQPPREALSATLHLLADLAVDSGQGGAFALAATGRGMVEGKFSVLG